MYNGHVDVTALPRVDGTIAVSYYYDAFGNILQQTGSVNNNITYAGYQYDSETGLYYLNSRYYDSKIARFLSEDTYTGDPNDPLSLNLYTYCINNPIMYTDPTGHYYYAGDDLIIEHGDSTVDCSGGNAYVYGNSNVTLTGNTSSVNVMSEGATATITNGGSSGNVSTSNGSNVTLNNSGTIGSISTGASGNTTINNAGFIGTVGFGAKSTNEINNFGNIGTVNNGGRTNTEIFNSGYMGGVSLGLGLSSLRINGENIVQRTRNIDYSELFNYRMGQNSKEWADEIKNTIFSFLDSPTMYLMNIAKSSAEYPSDYDKAKMQQDTMMAFLWYLRYNASDDQSKKEMLTIKAADISMFTIKQMVYAGIGYGIGKSLTASENAFAFNSKGTLSSIETTRVGQWMSKTEYEQFVKTREIPRTNVLTKGEEGYIKQANQGDYYVEFNVDSSLLVEKDAANGWSLVKSKNSMYQKLAEKKGQTLPDPIGTNIKHVDTK